MKPLKTKVNHMAKVTPTNFSVTRDTYVAKSRSGSGEIGVEVKDKRDGSPVLFLGIAAGLIAVLYFASQKVDEYV